MENNEYKFKEVLDVVVHSRIDKDTMQKLEKESEKLNKKTSNLIRFIIKSYLQDK